MGVKLNLVHCFSSQPCYVAKVMISNVSKGDIVQFVPLYGKEFGVLIQKIFIHCEEYCLFEGSIQRWSATNMHDLNDATLEVIL